jgi:hypothetical protein
VVVSRARPTASVTYDIQATVYGTPESTDSPASQSTDTSRADRARESRVASQHDVDWEEEEQEAGSLLAFPRPGPSSLSKPRTRGFRGRHIAAVVAMQHLARLAPKVLASFASFNGLV